MDDLKLNEGNAKANVVSAQTFSEYLSSKYGNEEYDPSKPNDYEELIAERLKF